MPTRLSPIIPTASDAILVGDPRRAFLLAQELTTSPLMSHLARGLWGYTGSSPAGRQITIQATGIGGPSAVTVAGDLAVHGVDRVVRLGTCLSLSESTRPGSVLQVTAATARDGTSRSLLGPGAGTLEPDPDLNALLDGLGRPGRVSSHDLVARLDPAFDPVGPGQPAEDPAVARDLQTAAIFALASRLSIAVAALLIVVDAPGAKRVDDDELESLFIDLGRLTVRRLQPAAA